MNSLGWPSRCTMEVRTCLWGAAFLIFLAIESPVCFYGFNFFGRLREIAARFHRLSETFLEQR
jgi:hypothetical protein